MSSSLLLLALAPAFAAGPPPATIARCADVLGADVVDAAKARTLRLETLEGSGSGFFVSPDGYLVTAAHVVGEADTVAVYDIHGAKVSGKVIRRDHESDLAIVKVDVAKATPCVPIAAERVPSGADVFVVGSPAGAALTHSVSKGVVSGYRETDDGLVVVQTDASINRGNSGGLLFSPDGLAVGIVSFKAVGEGVEGLGFAIGVENFGSRLGLSFGDSSDATIATWSRGEALVQGLLTMADRPASPAALALPKKCKGIEASKDEFTGAGSMRFKTEGMSLSWDDGEQPRLTVSIYGAPMRDAGFPHTYGQPLTLGSQAQVELKLEDGTVISFHPEAASWVTNGWFGYWLRLDGPIKPEMVTALGQSAVQAMRAHLGGKPVSQSPKDDKTSAEWLRRFACVAHGKGG